MRARRLGLTLGVLAALVAAPMASAAPPITVITLDANFITGETFTATGGVVCASGISVTDPFSQTLGGRQHDGTFTFHLIKTLTCDDDSANTFQILVDAAASPTSPGTVGGFVVVGGTGDYTGLRGGGSLVGTGVSDTEIIDVYTGRLQN